MEECEKSSAYANRVYQTLSWEGTTPYRTINRSFCMNYRWCLNLKLLSSSAYHCLSTSGFVKLPSERTLRDYTHVFKSTTGFQTEVDNMLREEVGKESWKKNATKGDTSRR